jgi:polyisoprenyl-teichoic acid--peptidoglycan teichoic acid transferase
LLCVAGGFFAFAAQRVLAFGSAISTQTPLSSQTGYIGGTDRVNILVMGYGGSGHDGAYLTDSMMVMSILPQSHHTTLLSVPRDLWVQIPANSGQYHKLNYAYVDGSNNGANPVGGGNEAAQKISLITGLDIKYWVTINFAGFTDFINSIGGIDVYVPDAFTANYPANDDPSINPNWIKIHFSKGMQHMDGKTAIQYARARYVIDNNAEGSDFARSARQQIIIKAALSKVRSWSTWPSMFNALTALQRTVYTNMSLADLAEFALKMDLNNAHRVGLSNQNVLVDATSSDGQAILLPANNNWQSIIDYVKQQLYN